MNSGWSYRLLWTAVLLCSLFLGYATILHRQTGIPLLVPAVNTGQLPSPAARNRPPSAGRYARLAAGRIFFGDQGTAAGNPDVFISGLTLRGIIQGPSPSAVLTRAGAPPDAESFTVHVGQIVLGEKVTAIGKDYITLSKGGQETVLSLAE